MDDLVDRLRIRATIRRQANGRKSVQEGKPDRLADLLDEAASQIEALENYKNYLERYIDANHRN